MSVINIANTPALKNYYKKHATIYDATRWSFLFGRENIITLANRQIMPQRILEVGCGTGTNLLSLVKYFPEAKITGIDLSDDMLAVAKKKLLELDGSVELINQKYDAPLKNHLGETIQYDMVLFSYALTMFNPGWEAAIRTAREQLREDGVIAVVDFHYSRFEHFRSWMKINHVRMDSHLLPMLQQEFEPVIDKTTDAYKGLWQYLSFIGRKKFVNTKLFLTGF